MEIHAELGVRDLQGLREASEVHRVRELPSMGPRTEENILEGLDFLPLGVSVARRGWLRKQDVIDTLTRRRLEKRIRSGGR